VPYDNPGEYPAGQTRDGPERIVVISTSLLEPLQHTPVRDPVVHGAARCRVCPLVDPGELVGQPGVCSGPMWNV
jgi:hypothetical protein